MASPPDTVTAKVRTAAQAFWAIVAQAVAAWALAQFGADVSDLSVTAVVALTALTTPIVAAGLMLAVEKLSAHWPVVGRAWVFIAEPTYQVGSGES